MVSADFHQLPIRDGQGSFPNAEVGGRHCTSLMARRTHVGQVVPTTAFS